MYRESSLGVALQTALDDLATTTEIVLSQELRDTVWRATPRLLSSVKQPIAGSIIGR